MLKIPVAVKIAAYALLVFLLIVLINAIDNLRIAYARNSQAIARAVAAYSAVMHAAPLTASDIENNVGKASGKFANAEFFDPAAVPGDRRVGVISADTQNLNPLLSTDATGAAFQSLCSNSLAERNYLNPEKFEPVIAESYEVLPDHLTYRIKLRKGIFWHDFTDPVTGKRHEKVPVTAHDFVFFFETVKNPEVNCEPLRVYYQDMESVKALDDYTLEVKWKKPYYSALANTLGMSPLPRHLYHAYPGKFDPKKFNTDFERNRIIVGSGPYRFVRWEKDKRVIFKRNPDYFGKRFGAAPAIENVVFEMIKHPGTAFQALLSGKVDVLGISPDKWDELDRYPAFRDKKIRALRYPAQAFYYLAYNFKNPLFADRKVRNAMSLLVDKERIIRDVFHNQALPCSGPYASGSSAADPNIKSLPYDPEKAKELLAQAGWKDTDGDGILDKDGKPFQFTILQVANNSIQQKMLPIIKESMAKAGVDMKIQIVEWSVLLQRLDKKEFDACTLGWALSYDPDLYQIFHSSQAGVANSSNFISYASPEADELIEKLRLEFDPEKRKELNWKLHRVLHEDQPYTFLAIPYSLQAISGRYRNVREFPGGVPGDLFWTPKEEQKLWN